MISICFVCLGNICRSPTAEGVMDTLLRAAGLQDQVAIDSAGTGAWHADEPADERAQAAAKARGIELTGRARRFIHEDFDRFDYVLAMDRSNHRTLVRMSRRDSDRAKIHLFRSFDPAAPANAEVPDPYYGGPRGFDEVLDICEQGCQGLLAHLRQTHDID